VPGLLCAGQYPGDVSPENRDRKLRGLLDHGIRRVVSLMEQDETSYGGTPFEPYVSRLSQLAAERGLAVECLALPIRDARAPSREGMRQILDLLDDSLARKIATYVHCWGGHGRTSTVVACHLMRGGRTAEQALAAIAEFRRSLPKSHPPFENDQEAFVRAWSEQRPL
jgi:predicted protein tyrosine phosphatase